MYVLRQLGSTMLIGAETSEAATPDLRHQIVDLNPRYIMQLSASGKLLWGQAQVAAAGTLSVPLPQAYVTTNNLHVVFTTDQTLELSTTGGAGASSVMVRAGLNQLGVLTQCGPITALSLIGHPTLVANVEWFLFELPAITTVAGWRDGSLATGVATP
jgi:hypothetical protein